MFGPIMQFSLGELLIRLAPFSKADMSAFITDGGLQTHNVTKYLELDFAPVIEDEEAWYDKIRPDETSRVWGIWVQENDGWKLIGNSNLHYISNGQISRATSGFLIFRPEYWGRGIASHCHKARAMYAFDQLNLTVVHSYVANVNVGSFKALERCGYVETHVERNLNFRDGRWVHKVCMLLVNPSRIAWMSWWQDNIVPPEFLNVRSQVHKNLQWARDNVQLL